MLYEFTRQLMAESQNFSLSFQKRKYSTHMNKTYNKKVGKYNFGN